MSFVTPLLLLGLLAAAIPPLLHLLSSVRAREVEFPTLRFLRASLERYEALARGAGGGAAGPRR